MSRNFHYKILPVTQRFVLADETISELRSLKPNFGYNGLGEFVFRRTYSRDNEDWADVVIRVIQGVFSIRKEHFHRNGLEWDDSKVQKYAHDMAISMFKMEWLPPGRGLWTMGCDVTYERGSMVLTNCAATDTTEDLVHSAEWAMDVLMCGVGCGFSTNWKGTATKPDKTDTELFVIPDNREGWVESLIKLMCSYIESPRYGKNKFPVFDYSLLRLSGTPIKTFGGLASGPDPLIKMHQRIEKYLDAFCDGYLEIELVSKKRKRCENCDVDNEIEFKEKNRKPYTHSRLVADIFNAIGCCVVAGNVRRLKY